MDDYKKKNILESEGYVLGFGRYTYQWYTPETSVVAIRGDDNESRALSNAWNYREIMRHWASIIRQYQQMQKIGAYVLTYSRGEYSDYECIPIAICQTEEQAHEFAILHHEQKKLLDKIDNWVRHPNFKGAQLETLVWKHNVVDDEFDFSSHAIADMSETTRYYIKKLPVAFKSEEEEETV